MDRRSAITDKVGPKAPPMPIAFGRSRSAPVAPQRRGIFVVCALLALAFAAHAQQPQPDAPQPPTPAAVTPAPAADTAQTPVPAAATPAPEAQQPQATAPAATPAPAPAPPSGSAQAPSINEEELKQQLVGKQFYLRGGYLGDTLNFDEHGHIVGHPSQGSYTLSIIQVDRVRLTKHKVELEGIRYGLHFNEQLAYEDSSTAYDKVRITPKKKIVKITIDREMVVKPKVKKESSKEKGKAAKPVMAPKPETATPAPAAVAEVGPAGAAQAPAAAPATPTAPPDQATQAAAATSDPAAAPAAESAVAAQAPATIPANPAATPDQATQTASSTPAPAASELSEADQLKASIAATPEAERPADPSSVTTTTSQAHANGLLRNAIDSVFALGLDERMMTAMPDYWKLYYQAVAAKADYRPTDPSILRQNTVDQKAQLLTSFEPESNDFAQSAGVAGMALYHTVIGADGRPAEIAVARPIGFGLDENAVAAIRKAKFAPATKNGQPVPVMLDLVVQFRIFSKRTAVMGSPDADKSTGPKLPGPYSVPHPTNPPQPSN